ncbi:hypothetical protein JCM19236_4988 [Vibrio sp. JCM 19236]|nr:hypothetical protein JCM19236_4988 [Vibrio sp. JCM 19236]
MEISRSSIAEARTQIYIGAEIEYLPRKLTVVWLDETKELSAMLTGLIKKLKATDR